MDTYDVIVIGGGPAGENAAQYAVAGTDRTAALVEGGLLGGECSYYACMPSKALLRPVEVRATAAHLQGLTAGPDLDVAGLLARRDAWVSHYDDAGQETWARSEGLDVIRGRGRLAGKRAVIVVDDSDTERTLHAREAVVIATGSVPTLPGPLEGVHPWTSRDATGVREVPGSIAIVGGGVVACEAAFWLAALGSTVTILERGERLLGRFEDFASELVADGLRAAGVEVRLGASVASATRDAAQDTGLGRVHGGPVELTHDADGADQVVRADEVLAATGRRPATDGLGLDSVGLSANDLRWNGERLPDWLYVVGDVSAEAPLTHWGKYQARLVGDRIADRAAGRLTGEPPADVPVPQVVFTDPQVATTGRTAAEAEQLGLSIVVLDQPMSAAAGFALLRDDAVGRARLVVDTTSRTVIGATFVGADVAEMVHAATVAIVARTPMDLLWHAVPSYPTASEIWLRLAEQWRSYAAGGA